MHLLIATLCLLSTAAILCGAQISEPSTAPVTSTTISGLTEGGTTGDPMTDATGGTATDVTTVTSTDVTTVTSTDVASSSKPTVDQPPPSGGLSDGAIAGITIGTIAGVAALGGGIYGVLKYTNKI